MDLRQLRYFVEVAEVRGFNEAAARLHVSQSSISRRVRDLELELKVQLFERDPGGARLTAAGRTLLDRATIILRQVALARLDALTGSQEPTGIVSLGISPACAQLFISSLMKRVAATLPMIQLRFLEGTQCALLQAIETNKVDLALVVSPGARDTYMVRRLPPESLHHISSGPHAADGEIEISRLSGVPLVLFPRPSGNRDYLDRAAALADFDLKIAYEINDLSVQKQLIRDNCAHGILPFSAVREEVARGDLSATPIRGLFISRAIIWRRSRDCCHAWGPLRIVSKALSTMR
ncbi:MAG: LysR family transcriptional regulator [Beijerinckiaceae bacterium]|nr:LysR family transcriptional regulator [Beijerinckiaceae bacterium]